jgi:ferredoxin
MRIRIDDSLCVGHGKCYTTLPALLGFDEEGYVTPRNEDIEVPPGSEHEASVAIACCPERAISLVNE